MAGFRRVGMAISMAQWSERLSGAQRIRDILMGAGTDEFGNGLSNLMW